jgi:hypothetical protein
MVFSGEKRPENTLFVILNLIQDPQIGKNWIPDRVRHDMKPTMRTPFYHFAQRGIYTYSKPTPVDTP